MLPSKVVHAQAPKCDTTYKLLTYGLPRFEYQNATAVVGREWCITYFAVAGCIVSKELVDSVRTVNRRVTADIVGRYGTDWEVRFDADVERALAAGAILLRAPKDQSFGERSATLQDPFGHRWMLSQTIEKITPAEMQARWDADTSA